jgi:hypothetical protein
MYLPAGFYTLEKLLKELNKYVNEYDISFMVLSGGRVGVSFNVSDISFIYRYGDGDHIKQCKYAINYPKHDVVFEITKDLKYMLGLETWVLHPEVERQLLNHQDQWKEYTQL